MRCLHMQVLISCTNVTAVKRMTETIKGKSLGSNMGMSLIKLLSGYRKAGDAEDANPHAPYIWDVDDIPPNPQAAIALLFDEDDANRSSTGSEKTDKLLFSYCPALQQKMQQMLENADEDLDLNGSALMEDTMDDDDDDEGDGTSSDTEQQRALKQIRFYKKFREGVRARAGRIYAYTATPITVLHDVDDRASQIDTFIIELKPSRNYVGYKTERSQEKWPWLEQHIQIVQLPNRVRRENFALTFMYPKIMKKYLLDFQEGDEMPSPFRTLRNGTIMLYARDLNEELELRDPKKNGARMTQTAGWLRDKTRKAVAQSKVRIDQFWREDGVNLVKVLRDIHENQEAYPQGYRNLLYMTNFSRGEKDQVKVVQMMLSLDGENEVLTNGLICVEFTYKHVRFSWKAGAYVDADCLFESAKSLMTEYAEEPVGYSFSEKVEMATAEEGEIQTLETTVPNINWGYSVLWKYMSTMRERDPSFFLKIMPLAGEIGARGVRYKSAKTHKFVLTDMFHAFAVSSTSQVCAHGAGALQAIGRLCSMVSDVKNCPTIKLWVPEDCWALIKLWMECFDDLPKLLKHKRDLETRDGNFMSHDALLKHITQDPAQLFPFMQIMLTAPTGHKKNGDPLYVRPDHMLKPNKDRSERLAKEPTCVRVDQVDLNDRHEERRAEMANHYVDRAAAENDDVLSNEEEQDRPLPPVAPGEKSIPEPRTLTRRTVIRTGRSKPTKLFYDCCGGLYVLESPISHDDRKSMTSEEKDIEELLFHQNFTSNILTLLVLFFGER